MKSLTITYVAGFLFAAAVWMRVFGFELSPVRGPVVLRDPMGDQAAIELQIDLLQRDPADSSAIATIAILDTLAIN